MIACCSVPTDRKRLTSLPLSVKLYAPGHGPVVRYSLSRLGQDYRQWNQQKNKDMSVALIYASAYGNTATLAQALAKGIQEQASQ